MNFEDWWRSKYPIFVDEATFMLIIEAWDESAKLEREACKRDCREVQKAHAGLVHPYHVVAGECIAAIDKRSEIKFKVSGE